MSSKGKIYILDDDELILTMLSRVLIKEGYTVRSDSDTNSAVDTVLSWMPDVVMLDIGFPDRCGIDILQEIMKEDTFTQVIMLSADDTAETAVRAMKLGAIDYLIKPFNTDEVKIVIDKAIEKESLEQEVAYLRKVYSESFRNDLIGQSLAIKDLISQIEKMAHARVSTILITGESGTGKEVVARNIHRLIHGDGRASYAPFVSINCAAIPESILESELFGHERGSFTDAKTEKKGLFEMASGGSILLDEIGDMRKNLQSKLLRVLEERTIRRVGGQKEIPVDLTVIATTNIDLSEAVKEGEFRQDLYYRLSAFYLYIPPLRDRAADISLLARHFLSHFAKKYNKKRIKGFSHDTENLLVSYGWPGNVRELKNLIERVVVLENTEIIMPEHLPDWIVKGESELDRTDMKKFVLPESGISLDEVEKDFIMQALEIANNNRSHAARLLNISYETLRYQLKKFGIQ